MRALFTTTAGSGHFHPLVPLAQALTEAGHEVAFAAPRSFGPTVEASGFRAFPAGRDDADGMDPEWEDNVTRIECIEIHHTSGGRNEWH